MIIPSWVFCDEKGCLEANYKKHSEKAKEQRKESSRLKAEHDQERPSSLVSPKSKRFGTSSMG